MTSSDSSIMSVRDMIDAAFGEPETNVVNHKLIQTILYLLAKQLRLLERHVKVEIGPSLNITSNTSLSITEIKLHAMQKKRSKPGKVKDDKGKIERAKADALSGIKGRSKETKDDKAPEITTTSEKSSSDKSSKHIASSDKTYPENLSSLRPLKETTSEDTSNSAKKMSTEKTSSSTSEKKTTGLKKTTQDYTKLLDELEELRERQLRIIHQRADSREVPQESPTPMASLESVEAQYEKLLIVERVPMEEAKARHGSIMTPTLSVVTQEQFAELEAQIKALQEKLAPTGKADFPENAQLLQELRKGASLTDAMAALQLSARLEAAEKTLDQMLSLLTEVAIKKPNIDQHLTKQIKPDKMDTGLPIASFKAPLQEISVPLASSKTTDATMPTLAADAKDLNDLTILDTSKQNFDVVTRDELKTAMQDLYDEIIKSTNSITAKSTSDAINALKIAKKMEEKLDKSVDLSNRMDDLETLVADYAEQINILDTGLSSQMTNYQEQLTQMQHDLESGLDNMAETLANAGGDTTAVTELNGHFSNLQFDLENMFLSQKELNDNQNKLSVDLEGLWQHIEVLRSTKADREEVADALRDKAGIAALNGLVSLQQFDAVQGDFEKRILTAYDKFNNQEMIWQKAIDDLFRGLNEKADYVQVTSLRDEIQKYLNMFDSRINAMSEILGEPRAAAILRKIHRDSACLSCATPAVMDLEEPGTIPALPALSSRSPGVGAESLNPKEDGDHLCYPRHPIPHQKDSRSHACNRYCGGSHTILNNMSRVPAGMVVTPIIRHVATGLGSDGKVYRLEDTIKPCIPCNTLKANSPRQSTVVPAVPSSATSGMTPPEFTTEPYTSCVDAISITPPPYAIYEE
uniref:DUF4795 domain-containing protein n=1 Tax=Bombyx mori TaxID=7091 RepID=A0A8R2M813_BOMMO|nr:uncharacterized protein LOC101737966 isoform X1 [Bombyx mori]